VRLDDAAEVELLQPGGIESGEEHVEDKEYVDLAFFEGLHLGLALALGAYVVKNEGAGRDRAAGDSI